VASSARLQQIRDNSCVTSPLIVGLDGTRRRRADGRRPPSETSSTADRRAQTQLHLCVFAPVANEVRKTPKDSPIAFAPVSNGVRKNLRKISRSTRSEAHFLTYPLGTMLAMDVVVLVEQAVELLEKANAELQPELLTREESQEWLALYIRMRELSAAGRSAVRGCTDG
jgi:hypothetical protein